MKTKARPQKQVAPKAHLIYPYDEGDRDVQDTVRVVLTNGSEEELKLRDALFEFVAADRAEKEEAEEGLEAWLEDRGFTLVVTQRLYWPFDKGWQ